LNCLLIAVTSNFEFVIMEKTPPGNPPGFGGKSAYCAEKIG
jgi:hypothetical protein